MLLTHYLYKLKADIYLFLAFQSPVFLEEKGFIIRFMILHAGIVQRLCARKWNGVLNCLLEMHFELVTELLQFQNSQKIGLLISFIMMRAS